MTQLLILTNSVDGSADYIAHELNARSETFFRWNVDLWQYYDVVASESALLISDPAGRTINLESSGVSLLWRKPFTDLMRFEELEVNEDDAKQARSQLGQWINALVVFMTKKGRTRLVEPFADRRLPKLFQLREAANFFSVPPWCFSCHSKVLPFGPQMVTKPLGDPSAGNGKIFYTRHVNYEELYRPLPWFVQDAILGGTDVTCVHILGRNYFYECDFQRNCDAIDWRVEINQESQSQWHPLKQHDLDRFDSAVTAFMNRVGLHFGRLDFVRLGSDLIFLECNSNGQFGWLDDPSNMLLHKSFLAAAINPSSQVGGVFLQ